MKRTLRNLLLLGLLAPLAMAQPSLVEAAVPAVVAVSPVAAMELPAAFEFDPAEAANDQVRLAVYPNPAADYPTASFDLERSQSVVIDVFDLLGRRVGQHELGYVPAGEHDVRLNLAPLPAGLYIVRLSGDAGARATVRITRVVSA